MQDLKCTIGDIYDFYNQYPEYIGEVDVETRYGYKQIEYADITAYDSDVYEIVLNDGKGIKASPDHLLYCNGWVKTKTLQCGDKLDTKNGKKIISNICKLDTKEDLYDLQVKEVSEFYANGIVSHNSTMIDAIYFALFGKPFRKIKKNTVVNYTNKKNTEVELLFKVKDKKCKIVRKVKPDDFKIVIDGKTHDTFASVLEQQKYLENHILFMDERLFKQTVILGSNYIPFMLLGIPDRRKVVEGLLDIVIFSFMNKIAKEKQKDVGKHKLNVSHELEKVNLTLKFLYDKVQDSNKDKDSLIQDQMALLKEESLSEKKLMIEGKELSVDIKEHKKILEDYDDVNILNKKKNKLDVCINIVLKSIEDATKTIKFYTNSDVCITCNQNIDTSFAINEIAKLQDYLVVDTKTLNEYKLEKKEVQNELDLVTSTSSIIQNNDNILNQIRSNVVSSRIRIDAIKNTIETLKIKKKIVEEYDKISIEEKVKKEHMEVLEGLNTKITHYSIIVEMLKDTGIKARIIKTYIPVINKLLKKYLDILEFPISFTFDEEFVENIKVRGRENVKYNNLSEGEKLRINLAMIFSFRELSVLRNSTHCNLIIFDEIADSSLDEAGWGAFLKIIKDITEKNTQHVFVISHRSELIIDNFENRMKFEKTTKGFSRYVVV